MKVWDVNINNIVISKLIETKTNSMYLIGYSDKAARQLVLIMPKMSEYVNICKVNDEDNDRSNEIISARIDDKKLFEKYEGILIKIKDLKNIELNALAVYDDRYIKIKIRTYGSSFHVLENDIDVNLLQSFLLILYFTVRQQILPSSIFRQLCL